MTDAIDPTVYRLRSNAFVGERTHRLTDDALTWEEEGKPPGRIAYDDIAEVRMTFAPTRAATNRYRTRIVPRSGQRLELFNTHYVGIADFPERNAAYVAFLTELHRRLAERGTQTTFRKGSSPFAYILNGIVTAMTFVVVAGAFLYFANFGTIWLVVAKIAIILAFVPVLIRFMRRTVPEPYDPRALPSAALPAVE